VLEHARNIRRALLATTVALSAMTVACGGGGGGTDSASACAENATAPIAGSIAELKQYFGGQTLTGRLCRPQCIYGGVLTILSDGSGGNINGTTFTVTSVCKNSAYPDTFFVSGVWPDGSKFLNALFLWQVVKVRNMTLPSSTDYFYMS
jgi:hypothetical protein